MKNVLAFFDFDGTITTKDSLGDFIHFTFGSVKTLLGLVVLAPTLMGYVIGFVDSDKSKQKVYRYFFKGVTLDQMRLFGIDYTEKKLPKLIRKAALDKLHWHQKQLHQIVIVSASANCWLEPWAEQNNLNLIATQLEVVDNKFTGNYSGQNCQGVEKVRRIKAKYDLSAYSEIYAYGDSPGDLPMLELAHHVFFKPFRNNE